MRWFSSKLVGDDPGPVMNCPNCERGERAQTKFMPIRVLPDRLSAHSFIVPRHQLCRHH
jgi:hypothetical protein